MRVFIAGGAGLIGSSLASGLSDTGFSVSIGVRRHVAPEAYGPPFTVISLADSNIEILASVLQNYDVVINCVGVSNSACETDLSMAFHSNAIFSSKLAEAAVASRSVSQIIYLSTVSVYGPQPPGSAISEFSPPQASHPYGVSHIAGERLQQWQTRGTRVIETVLRVSNVVGAPGPSFKGETTTFPYSATKSAVIDSLIELRSDGLAKRDWISLSDIVTVVRNIITSPRIVDRRIINVCSGEVLGSAELAQTIATEVSKQTGRSVPLALGTEVDETARAWNFANQAAQKALGRPFENIETAVRELVKYALAKSGPEGSAF